MNAWGLRFSCLRGTREQPSPMCFWGFNPIPEPGSRCSLSRCHTPSSALLLHMHFPSSIPRRTHPPRGSTLAKANKMQNNEQEAWEAGKLQGQELQLQEDHEACLVLFIVFTQCFVILAVKAVKKWQSSRSGVLSQAHKSKIRGEAQKPCWQVFSLSFFNKRQFLLSVLHTRFQVCILNV